MKPSTRLVHFEACPQDPFSPSSTPIYQTATFAQASATECGQYDYTRSGNPTRTVLERQLALLEVARYAFAFTSGMAALSTITRLLDVGGEILAGSDLYGGTYRLLSRITSGQGISVRHVDTTDLDAVDAALGSQTHMVLVETPTNPLQKITDLEALSALAHSRGALLVVDNTMLSPYLQKPLELGADIVVHSATKHLCGHGDVTGGVVAVRDDTLAQEIAFRQNAEGTALAPFDSWLLLRGMKTLSIRLDRQQATAGRLAQYLAGHSRIKKVHYPGLPDHPGRDLHFSQARGAGAVLSFETGSVETSRRIVEATRLFTISVSFGNVTSLISLPCRMSHASIPAEARKQLELPEDLVRLSVGIEDPDDLIADLEQAFRDLSGKRTSWERVVCCRLADVAGLLQVE
jgi:cystathionine beta-lyase